MSKYLSRRALIAGLAVLPIALATGPAHAHKDDAAKEARKKN